MKDNSPGQYLSNWTLLDKKPCLDKAFPVNSHTFWQEVVRPHPVAIGTLVLYQDIQEIPDQVELHTGFLQQVHTVHPYVWAYRCRNAGSSAFANAICKFFRREQWRRKRSCGFSTPCQGQPSSGSAEKQAYRVSQACLAFDLRVKSSKRADRSLPLFTELLWK